MLVLNLLIAAIIAGGLVLSAIVGGRAERIGAAAVACGVAMTWAAQAALGEASSIGGILVCIDLALSTALFWLFLSSGLKLWTAIANVAQLLVVVLSAVRFFGYPLDGVHYVAAMNIASLVVHLTLWFGAGEHFWRMRREGFGRSVVAA